MLDKRFIGTELEPVSAEVEKGQLRLFAKAVGLTDPVYFDEAAARDAGHPALPAPPTFAFSLQQLAPPKQNWLSAMGVPIAKVLHGEQAFTYFRPVYAGDVITLHSRVSDIYEKRGGALEFIVMDTELKNQWQELCVKMRTVTVVRN